MVVLGVYRIGEPGPLPVPSFEIPRIEWRHGRHLGSCEIAEVTGYGSYESDLELLTAEDIASNLRDSENHGCPHRAYQPSAV